MKRNGLGQIKNAVSIRERPPRSMSIFVILDVPGSARQTKTPTDCCASIFRAAPICPCTARPSSVLSQGSSMKGRERPCSIRNRLIRSQNVVQRSVELAAQSGHRPGGGRATYSTGNPFKFDDCRRKLGGTRWWPQNKRWPVDEA